MEKSHKIFLTDTALENLEDIPPKYITRILDEIEILETFPEIGFLCKSQNWQGCRQLIVDFYRVVYKVESDKKLVVVHLIKHGKRNFQ